jgi:hypothetical protein
MGRQITQSFTSLCLDCKYYNGDGSKYGTIIKKSGENQHISIPGLYCTKLGFFPETITMPRSIHNPIGAVPNVKKCSEFEHEVYNFYDEAERQINMSSLGATGPFEDTHTMEESINDGPTGPFEQDQIEKHFEVEIKFDGSGHAEFHHDSEVAYLIASGKKFIPDVDFEVDGNQIKWKNRIFNPTVFVHPKLFLK